MRGVMIARGDLGIEVAQKNSRIQQTDPQMCAPENGYCCYADVAFDDLQSRPTRAEVTDVANAIYYH